MSIIKHITRLFNKLFNRKRKMGTKSRAALALEAQKIGYGNNPKLMADIVKRLFEDLAEGPLEYDMFPHYGGQPVDIAALGFIPSDPIDVIVNFTPVATSVEVIIGLQASDASEFMSMFYVIPASIADTDPQATTMTYFNKIADLSAFDIQDFANANVTITGILIRQV